jgi:hypothetical protein
MKRIAISGMGLVLALGFAAMSAGAQDQTSSNTQSSSGQSLGDYARQVRKDPGTPAKAKVFDNDNLPREDKLSIVGKTTDDASASAPSQNDASNSPGAVESKPATGDQSAGMAKTPGSDPNKDAANKQWSDKLASQQSQIDLLNRELDVAQKEYQLRAAAMYADAGNRLRNSADWDKQDAQYKQQIADKQKALEDAKQKLDDMQEDARKAGVPNSVREQEPQQPEPTQQSQPTQPQPPQQQ